jgi:hypothetical protein
LVSHGSDFSHFTVQCHIGQCPESNFELSGSFLFLQPVFGDVDFYFPLTGLNNGGDSLVGASIIGLGQ